MRFIADLHLHSCYSRATSKNLNLESLYQWARIKGIHVVGTGDFTHPLWFQELEEKLEPDGNGFFRLKNPPREPGLPNILTNETDVRFCLSVEISSIYKYGEKVRKNHNIVFAPDFETAGKINARLSEIGNLASDGRPILGLPSRDLLEIVLETSANAHLIPAHVWTPWFSTLGSRAGYNSIEECFRDLSGHIFALETGLSSDPFMNWKVSALDKYALVSSSDAHSPQKLGRESNIFDTELSYDAMFKALKTKKGFSGTYEFFPEEGKYHLDGHRKCNVVLDPRESLKLKNLCPRCGKPLTIGVLNRVEELADRENSKKPEDSPGFEYIIPLPEIIAEFMGTAPETKAVQQMYTQIISVYGNEFELLHAVPVEEIKTRSGALLAEAIRRLREHEVKPQAGYDGEYGVINIFNPGEISKLTGQTDIFGGGMIEKMVQRTARRRPVKRVMQVDEKGNTVVNPNKDQLAAIRQDGNILVNAGPGTGKTKTLIQWIIHQVEKKDVRPREIIAITFTNKAADELRDRLQKQTGTKSDGILVGTFHAIAFRFLKEAINEKPAIYDRNNRVSLFRILFNEPDQTKINQLSRAYEAYHEENRLPGNAGFQSCFDKYHEHLHENHAIDLSAIIWHVNELIKSDLCNSIHDYKCLAIDEFQDINPSQYEFIKLISANKRVFAIGDPNQSVYGFRGSDVKLFHRITDDLEANEIFLTINYRTPNIILNASNRLISYNQQVTKTNPEAIKKSHISVKHFIADDPKQEARYIAEQVLNYVGGLDYLSTGQALSDYNYAFSDIAILCRTHRIIDEISRQLKMKGIPVLLSDATSFFSEPPFDVVANALRLLQNKYDVAALAGLADRLLEITDEQKHILLKKYIHHEIDFESFSQHGCWKEWIGLYDQLYPGFEQNSLQQTIQQLLDLFLPPSELSIQQQIKSEMIIKLAEECHENPSDFMQKYILSPFTDTGRLKSGGVRLMTFHASKGLEFPVVFIAGAEEGISPLNRQNIDVEEERRLFYVAMTRAMDELQITRSKKRRAYGSEMEMSPSRFLSEIDLQDPEETNAGPTAKTRPAEMQLKLF
ncbi:MAG: UvrD-helicase domain-containing protein [Bacteroidales bacterium]|nr:UvrD-helicase domain-containing protein [Bacteroidales bacterium]